MALNMTPELWGIVLDMVGRNLAPNNAFAGVGTALGQSSIASKKAAELKQEDQDFWKQIIGSLSGKEYPGPTSLNVTAGQNGLEYTLKGNEMDKLGGVTAFDSNIEAPNIDLSLKSDLTKNPNQTIDELIKSLGGYQI